MVVGGCWGLLGVVVTVVDAVQKLPSEEICFSFPSMYLSKYIRVNVCGFLSKFFNDIM